MTSGGNGEPFFLRGYAGLRQLGLSFKSPQLVKLDLSGFGGTLVSLQPPLGWRKTPIPGNAKAWITGVSRSGGFLQGAQESLRRPEHLFIQTEIVGDAFGSLLNPSARQIMWARHSPELPVPPPRTLHRSWIAPCSILDSPRYTRIAPWSTLSVLCWPRISPCPTLRSQCVYGYLRIRHSGLAPFANCFALDT